MPAHPLPITRYVLLLLAMPALCWADCGESIATRTKETSALTIEALEAASQLGDAVAQNELGRRFGLGNGVSKDSVRSFALYEQGAKKGLCEAQANLGFMYMNGEGTVRDLEKAKHWYQLAAEQGHARAAYSLGYIAAVFERNGTDAEKWFLAAADVGYLPAQRSLISLYQAGDIRARDEQAATLWLHRVRDATLTGKIWRKQ